MPSIAAPAALAAEEDTPSKVIALTFDDGPNTGNTVRILDILKDYNVKATFFVITPIDLLTCFVVSVF